MVGGWDIGSCGLVWRLIGEDVGGRCVADGEVRELEFCDGLGLRD